MTYLLPPNTRDNNILLSTDLICKDSQSQPNQTVGSPMLSAHSGSTLLLMYQENGHVTLLNQTPGKISSGNVFVYGTDQSLSSDTLEGIYNVWTPGGSGGDARGRLLKEASFDDGTCYQINSSPESYRRRVLPQRHHESFEGNDLWCGTEVTLPEGLVRGSLYTLYWVWDWPTVASPPVLPKGKIEIYTTCMDILII